MCRTVTLRLRFDDYTRATRSHTFPEATQRTDVVLTVARGLLAAAMPLIERDGITLLGLALGNLTDQDAVQLVLPLERRPVRALDTAVDDVRERFGSDAITRAVLHRSRPRDAGADAAGLTVRRAPGSPSARSATAARRARPP